MKRKEDVKSEEIPRPDILNYYIVHSSRFIIRKNSVEFVKYLYEAPFLQICKESTQVGIGIETIPLNIFQILQLEKWYKF